MRQKGVRRLFVLKKRLVLASSRSVSLFLPHTRAVVFEWVLKLLPCAPGALAYNVRTEPT